MNRRRAHLLLGVLLAGSGIVVGSCADDAAGPGRVRQAQFAVIPTFTNTAAGIVPLAQARFIVTRAGSGATVKDTTIGLAADQDSVDLSLQVAYVDPTARFLVEIRLLMADGTIAYRGGPVQVTPGTANAPVPVNVTFAYEGPGAAATSVVITEPVPALLQGNTVQVSATVLQGTNPVPAVPLGWESLDPARATISAVSASYVATLLAGPERGNARIVVTTPTDLKDTVVVPVQPLPNAIVAESGDGQTGTVGTALPQPLVARVTAPDGQGVSGLQVNFAVTSGGGSIAVATATTDAQGRASTMATLGLTAGQQVVTATTPLLPSASATFTSTGTPGAPENVTISAGNGQTGTVGASLAVPPAVLVTDANLNPVAGVDVAFEIVAGGGALTGANPVTNGSGIASLGSWTLGSAPGPNELRAYLPAFAGVGGGGGGGGGGGARSAEEARGAGEAAESARAEATEVDAGSPPRGPEVADLVAAPTDTVTFTATAVAGAPTALIIVSGDAQTGTVGTALAESLVVRVEDALANPLAGVSVDWAVTLGNGSVSSAAVATDGAGLAAVEWTLGTVAGTGHAVTASVSGAPSTAVYAATATPGTPAALAFVTQPTGALANAVITPAVEVEILDGFANRVTTDNTTAVDIAITNGTGAPGAVLAGTRTQTPVSGLVTFGDLAVDLPGSGYALDAQIPSLALVTSAPFAIGAPGLVAWINPAGGVWSDGANWSTGSPPGPTDTALIDLDGTYTVTVDTDPTVAKIEVGAASGAQTVDATGRAVTATSSGEVLANGTLILDAGTFSGNLVVDGVVQLDDGAINGLVTIDPTGTLLAGGPVAAVNGNVINNGTVTVSNLASAQANLTVTGTVNNAVGAQLTQVDPGTLAIGLANDGLFTVQATTNLDQVDAEHANTGTIVVSGGDLNVTQTGTAPTFTTTGAIVIELGRRILVSGGSFAYDAGTIDGDGTLFFVDNAVATFTPSFTTDSLDLSLTLGASLNGPGTVTNSPTSALLVGGASSSAAFNADLINQGMLTLRNSALGGALTTTATSVLLSSGVSTIAGSFTNNGVIDIDVNFSGPASLTVNGTLTNAPGGSINGIPAASTLSAELDNQGTVNGPLTLAAASAAHVNGGTIDLTAGGLTVTQSGTTPSFSSSGTITIGAGQTLTVTGGTFTNAAGGTIDGTGTLDVTGTTFTTNGAVNPGTSPGLLTVLGNTTWGTAAVLNIELGGTAPGTGYDRLATSGTAQLAGTLDVTLFGGFTPAANDTFAIMTFGTGAGAFAAINLPDLSPLAASTATSSGGTPDTLYVVVTAPPPVPPGTEAVWEGDVDADWSNPANWSTGVVPDDTTSVFVPAGTPNGVTIAGSVQVDDLVVEDGASVDIGVGGVLEAFGDVTAGTTIGGAGVLVMSGLATLSGSVADLTIGDLGDVTLSGQVDASGDVVIDGLLTLGGNQLNVAGDFTIDGGGNGTLMMFDPADVLDIDGDAFFFGNSMEDIVTDGVIRLAGNLLQDNGGDATPFDGFQPDTRVILDGTGPQQLDFVSGGVSESNFRIVEVTGTGPITSTTGVVVLDELVDLGGAWQVVGTEFGGPFLDVVGTTGGGTYMIPAFTTVTLASGGFTLTGSVIVTGQLDLGGFTMTVDGSFATSGATTGALISNDPASTLIVTGNATFGGTNTSPFLTDGVLEVRGDLTQAGPVLASFDPTGNHLLRLTGTAPQTLSFFDPTSSTPQNVEITNAAGITFASGVIADGQLIVPAGPAVNLHGDGNTLTVAGLDVDGLELDSLPLASIDGAIAVFDNVTFDAFDPSSTQLAISHPGAASPFTFTGLTFNTVPTNGVGFYIRADDNVADINVLTIDLLASAPPDGSGDTELLNGAVVNWPVAPAAVLVSHWAGDGDATDSADGNDGTLIGGTTFAPALINQAFSFDGVDDQVTIGNPANLQLSAGAFSVSAWVFVNALGGDMSIADKMSGLNVDGWRLALAQTNGAFWFCLGQATNGCQAGIPATVETAPVGAGVWNHVTAVKAADSIAIYLNGVLAQQKTLPAFTDNQSNGLLIGATPTTGASAFMNGLLDDVRVFSGALTATQIDSIFNAVTIPSQPIVWTNPAGGSWIDPANWGGGVVPGAGDTTVIDLAGAYTVSVPTPQIVTVSALLLGGPGATPTLDIAAFSNLAISDTANVAAGATVVLNNTGRISGAGTLTVDGALSWLGGTMGPGGITQIESGGSLALTGPDVKGLEARALTNLGTVTWADAGGIAMSPGATILNAAGATWTVSNTSSINGGVFDNQGTLIRSGNAFATTWAPDAFVTTGTVDVQQGLFSFASLPATGSWSGTVTVAAGAQLQFDAGTYTWNDGLSLTGPILLSGPTNVTVPDGAVSLTGDLTLTGGTLTIQTGDAGGATTLSVDGNVANTGGTIALENASSAAQDATLIVTTGALTNGGALVTSGTATGGGTRVIDAAVTNQGTLSVVEPLVFAGGSLTSEAGAVVDGAGTLDVVAITFINDGAINPGTSPGILTITDDVASASNAVLNVEIGGTVVGTDYDRLDVPGNFSRDGTLDIALINGFSPAVGDSFAILTFGSQTGEFASVTLPNLFPLVADTASTTLQSPDTLYVVVSGTPAPPGTDAVWTGATDTDWNNPANWDIALAPTSTTSVFIPAGTPNEPAVAGTAQAESVFVATGAAFTIGAASVLTATGSVDAGNSIGGSGTLVMTGAGTELQGTVPGLDIQGRTLLRGRVTVNGSVTLTANLDLQGNAMEISGDFTTPEFTPGVLSMHAALDSLIVGLDVNFTALDAGLADTALTDGVITVSGNFSEDGDGASFNPSATGNHKVVLNGGGAQVVSTVNAPAAAFRFLEVVNTGDVTAATPIDVTGDLTVGASGSYDPGGFTTTVQGNFGTVAGGVLRMTSPTSQLQVTGNASFGGGSTDGLVFDGFLTIGGNFDQAGNTESFHPGGSHTTVFDAGTSQTITFANPGIGPGAPVSHFANVAFNGAGAVTLASDAYAHSNLISAGQTAASIIGGGNIFAVGGLDVDDLTFDGVLFEWNGMPTFPSFGSFVVFDNVTFTNYQVGDEQFRIVHPGAATAFAMNGITFTTTPTTGSYIFAADSVADANTLTIDLGGTSPLDGSAFTATVGGAVVNWPLMVPPNTEAIWEGDVDTDWFNAGNWDTGVPDASTNAFIPASAPSQPVIGADAFVDTLVIQDGASLTVNATFTLEVAGDLDAGYTSLGGAGTVRMVTATTTLRGSVPTLEIQNSIVLADSVIVNGDVTGAGGVFDLSDRRMTVTGDFLYTSTLVMDGANDTLAVLGNFSPGGPTTVTGGTLIVSGDFNTLGAGFAGGVNHLTVLDGSVLQTVDMAAGQAFGDLEVAGTGGMQFNAVARVVDALDVTAAAALTGLDSLVVGAASGLGTVATVSGASLTFPVLAVRNTLTAQAIGYAVDTTVFFGTATQTIPDSLPYQTVFVDATGFPANVQFGGTTAIAGNLHIRNSGAQLSLNGRFVTVNGDLIVGSGIGANGDLVMQNPADSLVVLGNATFQGDPTGALLSAGALDVAGTFTQVSIGAVDDNYAPTGTHTTILSAPGLATVSFQGPGTSFFNNLTLRNTGDVTALTAVTVTGNLTVDGGSVYDPGGFTTDVQGDFSTVTSGTLRMTAAADQLVVGGSATFSGGGTNGLLTDGILAVSGDFTQTGLTVTYDPTINHLLRLEGTVPQTVSFGSPAISDIQGLEVTSTATAVFATDASVAGTVANSGVVDITAGATLAVDGTFSHLAGAVLQGDGTLDLFGAQALPLWAGTIAPGTSPGVLTITGDLPQGGTSAYTVELDGPGAGTGYDQLDVSGTATINGTFDLVAGFTPVPGDSFTVLTFGARGGTGPTVTGLDLGGGTALDTVFTSGGLILNTTQTVGVGTGPRSVNVNATTNTIYVANSLTNDVTIIDGTSNTVSSTLPVPGAVSLFGVGVNAMTNKIYVADNTSGNVHVIDGSGPSVVTSTPVGSSPDFLAVDEAANRIYVPAVDVGVALAIFPIDGSTDAVVLADTVHIGGPSDDAVGIAQLRDSLYVARADGLVMVVDLITLAAVDSVPVGTGPFGVAANTVTDKVYVANETDGTVSVINAITSTVITTVTVGSSPEGLVVDEIRNLIYVANAGSETVSVIDGSTDVVVATITTGSASAPADVGLNTATGVIYIANFSTNDTFILRPVVP